MMKRLTICLSVLCCFCSLVCFAQYGTQFENRGFENWANFGSGNDTNEPVHWHSGMSAEGGYSNYLSKQIEPSTVVRPGSTGSKSARLWPRTINIIFFSVTANGNLTTGRVYAGDMTASGSNNYNYTIRSQGAFNTPISVVPDSLALWVCFRSDNANQDAQVKAFVHCDADFKSRANGTVDPADKLVATATKNFKRTSSSGGSYVWKRLSIPFVHDGTCNDPRYILLNITTNKTPGEGNDSDDLFIDDVLLVYNPTIHLAPLDKDIYKLGESINISYTLTGTMSPENLNMPTNRLTVELSGPNGSFSNPTELCSINTNTSGSLDVTIPYGIVEGNHYRIRLVTTNYPMVSNTNGTDLIINATGSEIAECYDEEEVLIETYDSTGRKVDNENLTPGIYIAKYRTKNGGITVKKILKR